MIRPTEPTAPGELSETTPPGLTGNALQEDLAVLAQDIQGSSSAAAAQLELLLEQFERARAGGWLADAVNAAEAVALQLAPDAAAQGLSIGRFTIERELGRGGFGVVFLARDGQGGAPVALKIPLPEILARPGAWARFAREAQAIGSLNHPNILRVVEARQAAPLFYIATEYCSGPTLAAWLASEAELPNLHAAARLVASLADAVDYAHAMGVLHRDIKPGNILLQPPADDPWTQLGCRRPLGHFRPKLGDFGLAKLIDEESNETVTGVVLGTPSYMAPEQVGCKSGDLTAATDVYGLGTVLYELLSGRPPFAGRTHYHTVMDVLTAPPVAPRRLRGDVPAELEAIALKALEKAPRRRYRSAAELAQDLRRFLAGRPTLARPQGRPRQALRWARRRPAAALACALAILAPLAVSAVMLLKNWELRTALQLLAAKEREASGAKSLEKETNILLAQHLFAAQLNRASHALHSGRVKLARETLERYWVAPLGNQDFAWRYLWGICHAEERVVHAGERDVYCVSYSPDGSLLASAGADGVIRLWEPASGAEKAALRGHTDEVNFVAFSPDGNQLASASDDGAVRIWNVATGQCEQTLCLDCPVIGVVYSPIGDRLVSADKKGRVEAWQTADWQPLYTAQVHNGRIESLAYSPDGQWIASCCNEPGDVARIFRAVDGQPRREWKLPNESTLSVCFSSDSQRLTTAHAGGSVRQWNVATGRLIRMQAVGRAHVQGVGYSRNGGHLATAGDDGVIFVANADLHPEYELRGHTGGVWCTSFSPDGTRLASGSRDGTIRLWPTRRPAERAAVEYPFDLRAGTGVLSPDGHWWAQWSDEGDFRVGRAGETAAGTRGTRGLTGRPGRIALANDAAAWAAESGEHYIHVWRQDETAAARMLGAMDEVASLQFSAGGEVLAAVDRGGKLRCWDARDGRLLAQLENVQQLAAIDEAGTQLAVVRQGLERTFEMVMLDGRSQALRLCKVQAKTVAAAFNSEGSLLVASPSCDEHLEWFATASAQHTAQMTGTSAVNGSLRFSVDDRHLLVNGHRGVFLWDLISGQEVCELDAADEPVYLASFGNDGVSLLLWHCRSHRSTAHWISVPLPQNLPPADPRDLPVTAP